MKRSIKLPLLGVLPAIVFLVIGASSGPDHGHLKAGDEIHAATMNLDSRSTAEIWKEECASCHGIDGKGQTKAGKRAGVKDFTDPEYQKGWTDAEALKVISTATKDGKQLKNKKPWAEKLSPNEIKQMISFVREFAKQG